MCLNCEHSVNFWGIWVRFGVDLAGIWRNFGEILVKFGDSTDEKCRPLGHIGCRPLGHIGQKWTKMKISEKLGVVL